MKSVVCVIFLCISYLLIGCSRLNVKPEHINGYNNGIAILQQQDDNNKLQLEIAQTIIGGFNNTPLLLYITIENLSNDSIIFDTNNIALRIGSEIVHPLAFSKLRYSGLDFSDALYDYGIAIADDQRYIRDPFFSASAYRPLFYPVLIDNGLIFTYRFYDYSFALNNTYFLQKSRSEKAIQKLSARYLRKNTLVKNDAKGGFIVFRYKDIKKAIKRAAQDSIPMLIITIGNKQYHFNIALKR